MQCAACRHENDAKSKSCANCGANLRRRRKRGDDDAPLSQEAVTYNEKVAILYVWCMFSLVPVLGLLLGPVVAWRAWRYKARAAREAELAGAVPVSLAMWLGLISTALSWGGLALMVAGLWLG